MSRLLAALACLLAAACAMTSSGPTSLVRGSVETDGAASIWSDGTALVVLAPALAARIESKAPEVFQVPPEYAEPLELEGRALLIRFYPFGVLSPALDEPWPAWARGSIPPAVAEQLLIQWAPAE